MSTTAPGRSFFACPTRRKKMPMKVKICFSTSMTPTTPSSVESTRISMPAAIIFGPPMPETVSSSPRSAASLRNSAASLAPYTSPDASPEMIQIERFTFTPVFPV